jgi:hypothetical protein
MKMHQRRRWRDLGISIAFLLCFPGYDINEPYNMLPQKYWSLQELYEGCDFYSMVEDYDKQHPEEAEAIGFKVYWNDGMIDVTEAEAMKIEEPAKRKRSDGEQLKKSRRIK